MKQNKKLLIKMWGISFALAAAAVIVIHTTKDPMILLITRLAGTVFYIGIYIFVRNIVKKQEKMIKDSDGFMQAAFNPKILQTTIALFIIGWTAFSFLDYLGLNYMDWIMIFTLGIILIPISLGLIPLRVKDNGNWRR